MADEQVKLLEKELEEVINYCQSSKLNQDQLRKCAEPLLQISKSQIESWIRKLAVLSFVVGVIAVLFQWSVSYRWICVFAKCFALQVLPYWDWTGLHRESCILYNPYLVEENLTEEDCEVCEDYGSIDHQRNISHSTMANVYLFDNMPIVITDAAQDWKATQDFSIDYIKQLYNKDKVLSKFDLCNYKTATGHRFVQVRDNNIPKFHVYWENCFMEPMKALRTYYSRPYFLPPMVETGTINIVAMASPVGDIPFGHDHYKLLSYNSTDSMTWFSQVRGQYFIRLSPRSPCDKICQKLHFVLKEGETLVLPNDMWLFQFAPHGKNPSIAIGATGTWDQ
ncbi:uncharacterized protein [Amphiura filiformis]|uniref:uncharacterized protein n=1 Tax=Amphiura filiformis TaxID=82378 RepID=UPI003B20EA05